jgi:hypothetical protein
LELSESNQESGTMGVEYRHFLVVSDIGWQPQSDTAARVEAVLCDWSLVDRPERIVNLAQGRKKEIKGTTASIVPGPGVAFVYAGTRGLQVQRLAGPSFYEGVDPAQRYTMSTTLVLGRDYRVHASSEELYFELITAPSDNGEPIEANGGTPPDLLFDTSFPSTDATSPPVVKVHVHDLARHTQAWTDYTGVWRGALIIDFGKDLPAFVDTVHALPTREFVAQISNAFRGPVAEIGEFY